MAAFAAHFDNYRIKLLLSIFLVNFCLIPLLLANRLSLTRRFIYERENVWIEKLVNILMSEIRDDLKNRDTVQLNELLSIASQRSGIAFIMVTGKDGTVFFSGNRKDPGTVVPLDHSPAMSEERSLIYTRIEPLKINGISAGFLRLGYSLDGVRKDLRQSLYWGIAVNAAAMMFILFAAFFISGRLFRPLSEMKTISNRIARGDFSARAGIRSHDAIGDLAAALNDMARQLQELTSLMQQKIEQATGDLRTANAALAQKAAELEESNRKLKELDTLKSDFVSMVSHELKTPLTSIIGFARTLLTLDLPADRRAGYLSIIESEGKRLAGLIAEYLDISKIEAGKFTLNYGQIHLPSLLREIYGALELQQPGRLVFSIDPAIGNIDGDKDRMHRAIANIIDNALKYSPAEEKVRVNAERHRGEIIITIEDRGIGVPAAEREKIFEKFYRGKSLAPNRFGGSGLGLTIARAVVKAHGGRITVEPAAPKGARFVISIPEAEIITVKVPYFGDRGLYE